MKRLPVLSFVSLLYLDQLTVFGQFNEMATCFIINNACLDLKIIHVTIQSPTQ